MKSHHTSSVNFYEYHMSDVTCNSAKMSIIMLFLTAMSYNSPYVIRAGYFWCEYGFCNHFVIATCETGTQLPSFMSNVNPVWVVEIGTEVEISCVLFVCCVAY